jgi:hypothetical protein
LQKNNGQPRHFAPFALGDFLSALGLAAADAFPLIWGRWQAHLSRTSAFSRVLPGTSAYFRFSPIWTLSASGWMNIIRQIPKSRFLQWKIKCENTTESAKTGFD